VLPVILISIVQGELRNYLVWEGPLLLEEVPLSQLLAACARVDSMVVIIHAQYVMLVSIVQVENLRPLVLLAPHPMEGSMLLAPPPARVLPDTMVLVEMLAHLVLLVSIVQVALVRLHVQLAPLLLEVQVLLLLLLVAVVLATMVVVAPVMLAPLVLLPSL
jgi:hypothetical protein